MQITRHKALVEGVVTAPPSKSYAQRAIAAALLAHGETTLTNMALCNDTHAALGIAAALGAEVHAAGTTYIIRGGLNLRQQRLSVGESGLATRLFTPVAALCNVPVTLMGEGSIMSRPVEMMVEPLRALGAKVSTHDGLLPMTVCGPLHGGQATVDGSLSSQFVTGLLTALPLAEEATVLTVTNLKSRPYIDMTVRLLEVFGVEVKNNDYKQFYVEGGQHYLPTQYNIEGDWSGASCLLVAGATAGEVTVENLNPLSLQADMAIIDALTRAGAEITTTSNAVRVRRRRLGAFRFDATDCPDLFPALVALAAACDGVSEITGTERLIHKESNRAQTLAEIFGAMGVDVDLETENTMRITGGDLHGTTVSSHNDHRIAMAAAVAALRADTPVTITEAEAIDKSYPEFWDDLDRIVHPIGDATSTGGVNII